MSEILTMDMINEARERLRGVAQVTGLSRSHQVSEKSNANVYLKMENLQRTGSFKLRGAYNKVASLADDEKKRGVIAASAGNHAQGVALAAKTYGTNAVICMPEHAPMTKVKNTKSYGAEVVLKGAFFDDAAAEARHLAKERGLTFVHPYDDPLVMAGQGTIACEILEQLPETDVIVVPVGGGGLIAGIAFAAKHIKPEVKIIGVQTENIPSMKESVKAGRRLTVDGPASLADGIMVKTPGENTFEIVREYVDDIITVDESEIAQAILLLIEEVKTVPEGAGACPTAALINGKVAGGSARNIVSLISGGNIDINTMTRVIDNGLVKDQRKVFFDTVLPDRPGSLVEMLSIVSATGANILNVNHERSRRYIEVGYIIVSLELETRDAKHVDMLRQKLRENNYEVHMR
ncbi:MAG: threonine ammonia-lyase [Anaerovoracaceae bacterium]|jgi:threonine dehydratase